MRTTWDALAANPDLYAGDPARAEQEIESLFARLGADPRGGTCIEVGCGHGRMTGALARRFDRVLALDVSPAMLDQARAAADAHNVEFRIVSGEQLDGVDDAAADVVICYLVLQHLPSRHAVASYFKEFARVLTSDGEAFVQIPVLDNGPRARLWRMCRSAAVPLTRRLGPTKAAAFRGFRLTRSELDDALAGARLRVVAQDTGPDAPYRYSSDVFLRLVHA